MQQVKPSLSKRRQPHIIPVLVLILALAVQGTAGQLWDKVPLFSRFTKAAQAAKAAAASFTAPHAPPSTSSLPPAIAAPVVPFPSDPEDAPRPPPPPPPAAPAQPPTQQQQQQAVPPPASKKGNAAEKPSTRTTGRNDTQAGCGCLAEWVAKPGGEKLSGCANPDNDPLVSSLAYASVVQPRGTSSLCVGVATAASHQPSDQFCNSNCRQGPVEYRHAFRGHCLARLQCCPDTKILNYACSTSK